VIWDDSVKNTATVEPLSFRNLQEATSMTEVNNEGQFAEPTVDLELSLREAHERGHREGRESLRLEVERRLAEERANVSRVVEQFDQEKQCYFSEVEREVVRLSLAIAEHVLHREAEMDPTLLAGVARVALEQVAESSGAVLRVSSEDAHRWNETLGMAANKVQIEPDTELARGEVILKTRAGSVQLGLKAQLQEIERGFFELLRCRPTMAV